MGQILSCLSRVPMKKSDLIHWFDRHTCSIESLIELGWIRELGGEQVEVRIPKVLAICMMRIQDDKTDWKEIADFIRDLMDDLNGKSGVIITNDCLGEMFFYLSEYLYDRKEFGKTEKKVWDDFLIAYIRYCIRLGSKSDEDRLCRMYSLVKTKYPDSGINEFTDLLSSSSEEFL